MTVSEIVNAATQEARYNHLSRAERNVLAFEMVCADPQAMAEIERDCEPMADFDVSTLGILLVALQRHDANHTPAGDKRAMQVRLQLSMMLEDAYRVAIQREVMRLAEMHEPPTTEDA